MKQKDKFTNESYTAYLDKVIASEQEYLGKRRETLEIPPDGASREQHRTSIDTATRLSGSGGANGPDEKLSLETPRVPQTNLWGFAISGGGIRSATWALGIIQGLTKSRNPDDKGLFRRFDYLSTVSGGGYIGGCLSSLLSNPNKETGWRSQAGVDAINSPFVGLDEHKPFCKEDDPVIPDTARDQIHHLRSHGNYLAGNTKILGFDMQVLIGAAGLGTLYNLLLFAILWVALVATIHFALAPLAMPDADSYKLFGYVPVSKVHVNVLSIDAVFTELKIYLNEGLIAPLRRIFSGEIFCLPNNILFFVIGLIGYVVTRRHMKMAISHVAGFQPPGMPFVSDDLPAGVNREDRMHNRFIARLNLSAFAWAIGLTAAAGILNRFSLGFTANACVTLVPLAFALGRLLQALLNITTQESNIPDGNRVLRSAFSAVKGSALLGTCLAVLWPIALVFAFSTSLIDIVEWLMIVAVAIAGTAFTGNKLSHRNVTLPDKFFANHYATILNLSVVLFLLLMIPPTTKGLFAFYAKVLPSATVLMCVFTAIGMFCIAWVLTKRIDSNKISPFSFYRDRLTEAYLQTDARVERVPTAPWRQGMPLKSVRNDENLMMQALGNNNMRGPYHLITAALNINGSNELVRKVSRSDHFLFSKFYCGSQTTGYVTTDIYHGGEMRLARAVAVSGAAASSQMGIYTFFALEFLATLFNLRLGQWMENPWFYSYYKRLLDQHASSRKLKRADPESKPAWLKYMALEMWGKTSAQKPLINISDGGHTGDNLGLLPLLQRRCSVIVVCDADADGKYLFQSFNNAVRLAMIEENIEIDIDLNPLRRGTGPDRKTSRQSVVVGTIRYPEVDRGEHHPPDQPSETLPTSTGVLIYLKASLSTWNPESDAAAWEALVKAGLGAGHAPIPVVSSNTSTTSTASVTPTAQPIHIPAHVENYARKFTDFPHQSTGDQFFDMEQFEAYRALGEHIADEAARVLAHCK